MAKPEFPNRFEIA